MNTNDIVLSNNQALNLVKACLKLGQVRALPLDTGINLFIKIKTVEGVRTATIHYYKQLFVIIKKHLKEFDITETSQINNDFLFQYVAWLMENNFTNLYINKLIGGIKHLVKKLSEHDHIDQQIFTVKKLKEEVKEIKTLDLKRINEIIEYSKTKPLSNRLAFRLFIETGIRKTELINIKVANIDFKKKSIYLTHTKNHEPRYMFLSDTSLDLIKSYLETFKEEVEYLFSNPSTNQKMTTMFVDTIFRNLKSDLGFDKIGPHLLRHTFCTAIARSNVDYKSLQKLMGHKTMSMTLRYIEVVNHDILSNLALENNPLSKM